MTNKAPSRGAYFADFHRAVLDKQQLCNGAKEECGSVVGRVRVHLIQGADGEPKKCDIMY